MVDQEMKPGPTIRQQQRDALRASSRFSDALQLAAMMLSDLLTLHAPGLEPADRLATETLCSRLAEVAKAERKKQARADFGELAGGA